MIVVDGKRHLLEVLEWTLNGDWRSLLHFTVFDRNPYYRGRKGSGVEPREILVADLTNDNLQDVVILVHDRVIVYPQLR